ncbi:MAG TPA: hypothetical protein VF407_06470, partial [Polyangiaceae bacterium]
MRTKRPAFVVVFAATAAIAAIACGSGSSDRQCSSGADCASGACNADGTCVVTSTGGSDSGAITTDDSGSKPVVDASYTVDASSLACSQNTDDGGTLGHDNVPLAAGLSATFLVAQNETISTAGILNADGSRTWDFSGSLASDQKVIVQTLSPSGQWWSGDFATATYASKLQSSSDLLGIFDYAADSLKLPGVASPTSTTPK